MHRSLGWRTACAVFLFSAIMAIVSSAQTFTTLADFNVSNGAFPSGSLVQGTDGNFYGTTLSGGANGDGTVFKITSSGTLTTLYSFCSQTNCSDGTSPFAGLVQGSDGNFYGTTSGGGAKSYGTVFKMTSTGALTTLYSFCSQSGCSDGSFPEAGLVQGSDGNFYGTTDEGGTNGDGTVFKITSSGTLTTLYSFCSKNGCSDGENPSAGLVQGSDGNFYGATENGGANGNNGTVFKITPAGTLTTLYSFCSAPCTDGANPNGLVQASDGNFYGTTGHGGANDYGTIFKITPTGTLTTLYSFCSQSGCSDGEYPIAGLMQAVNGTFYGTTSSGGSSNDGTVFSLVSASVPRVYSLGDFNGNGKADILWRETVTGQNAIWFMNGATVSSMANLPSVSNLNWRIVGVGDFNGDGEADILWRNKSTGQNAIWLMNGSTVVSSPLLPTASDLNWHIVGVGDFNGNGKADILWRDAFTGQNAIWFMNGGTVTSMANLPTVSDLNWQVVGVGDFNGNGKADILWRDAVTGQNSIWFMNGSSVVSTPSLPTVSDPNWQVVGVGDFNGNGKADILWRHALSGENTIWFMNGSSVVSTPSLPTVSDENWQVVGVGDFNGNGDDDILWRHALSGENTIWFMNGATVVSTPFLSTVTDLNWLVF